MYTCSKPKTGRDVTRWDPKRTECSSIPGLSHHRSYVANYSSVQETLSPCGRSSFVCV